MLKRDELVKGCVAKARDDEWIFALLGRDKAAPSTIRHWIGERLRLGLNKPGDAKLVEAEMAARAIEAESAREESSKHDTSWHPESEAPDQRYAGPNRNVEVLAEDYAGDIIIVYYVAGSGFRSLGDPVRVRRWRYIPLPPTPEDDALERADENVDRLSTEPTQRIQDHERVPSLYLTSEE